MTDAANLQTDIKALRDRAEGHDQTGLGEAATALFARVRSHVGETAELDRAGVALIRACRRSEDAHAIDDALASPDARAGVRRKAIEAIDAFSTSLVAVPGRGH